MSDTWSTSRQWSFPVKADGSTAWSARQAIWDWFNSQAIPGNVQEVEIGVTLTSKASTPPTGSASPSTVEPIREGNGAAGSYDRKAVEALLKTYLNEINDPAVSEIAAKAAESDVLRERVRVLEEALREIDAEFDDGADPKTMRRLLDAALLSPAAATEGGEGA